MNGEAEGRKFSGNSPRRKSWIPREGKRKDQEVGKRMEGEEPPQN